VSSNKEIIYRGSKGSFHRKNQNSRAVRTTNWLQFFIVNYCGGSIEECEKIVNRYHELNNGKDTKTQANGMLSVFIEQGAKETLLREVFGIGSGRYSNLLLHQSDKVGGGRNGNAVSQAMLDQLYRFSMHVPTELGYPCGHRRMLKYCTRG
jgi:hypothetical protein